MTWEAEMTKGDSGQPRPHVIPDSFRDLEPDPASLASIAVRRWLAWAR